MQCWCQLNCPPAIYNALYYLRQDSSALLNISNEWSGVENSVLPFLRARKYLASLAEALGASRIALSFVRFALSHRLMIIRTGVVSLAFLGLHRAPVGPARREKKTVMTLR